MKEISVIVPVYNVENYLDQCIQSILNQSFPKFELILINDGSTDRSGEICERYAKKDDRITLIHQENKGLSMARNKGLKVATGEYITFVDSDDSIHSALLNTLYSNLMEHQADISIVNYQSVVKNAVPENIRVKNNVKVLDNITAVNKVVGKNETNMIIAMGKLYKSNLFDGIQYPQGKYHEDEFVTYRLLYQAKKVVISGAKLYYYIQRKDSITGNSYSLKRLEKLEGLNEAIDFFEEKNEKELKIKAKIRYLLNIQIAYYRVKYELVDEIQILKTLKKEYDFQYQTLKNTGERLSLFQTVIFKFFNITPNLYSFIVRVVLKAKDLFIKY